MGLPFGGCSLPCVETVETGFDSCCHLRSLTGVFNERRLSRGYSTGVCYTQEKTVKNNNVF